MFLQLKNVKAFTLDGNMTMSITVILSEHHLQDKNNLIKIHNSISNIKSEAIKNLSKKFLKILSSISSHNSFEQNCIFISFFTFYLCFILKDIIYYNKVKSI